LNIRQESEDHILADRLVNYSDAIVTLSFLVSSGLGLSIADPDTRVTMTDVALGMVIGNVAMGVFFSFLVAILRRWELDLRVDTEPTEKYQRYSNRIYVSRHVVIWLTITQTVTIMFALGI
jgi:hypothetical protein